jgi:hypothetical protein
MMEAERLRSLYLTSDKDEITLYHQIADHVARTTCSSQDDSNNDIPIPSSSSLPEYEIED